MPRKSDTIPIKDTKFDKRVKLTLESKQDILKLKETISLRECARRYDVDRRTIDFIWYPHKKLENIQRRKERGGSKQYYDREKHTIAIREHRNYKKELHNKGLI
jgi:hypothetical protein